MFIAFEGPDKTGKSTSAANLAASGEAVYNARKDVHALLQKDHLEAPELPITYDRIDWLTHMVYRLAMPDHEWNDARVRTVFAMPDTHLVIKLHHHELVGNIEDELYEKGRLTSVNEAYHHTANYLAVMNQTGSPLFKTITVMEVINDLDKGTFSQSVVSFSAPGMPFGTMYERLVKDDETLLELLRYVEHRTV